MNADQPEFATKTLLISDLVDSTRIVQQLGDLEAAKRFQRHDQLARSLIAAHGGREIDKSDGFLVLFDRPGDAVNFALAFQQGLQELAVEDIELATRIGIHVGEVILIPNTPAAVARGAKAIEVEGLAKPLAARLMALAQARQVLLSRSAYDLVNAERPSSAEQRWMRHGYYMLKGIYEPVEVFEIGISGFSALVSPSAGGESVHMTSARRPSLLVLPFDDLTANESLAYVGYGLSQDLLSELSRVRRIRVMAPSVSVRCGSKGEDSGRVGREVGATHLLRGSVRSEGARLSVTASLLDTSTAEWVWIETYQIAGDQLFEVERQIREAVVATLAVDLGPEDRARDVPKPDVQHIQVYEYYVRARQEIVKFTAEGLQRALAYLDLGLKLDPNSIPLLATRGYAYWQHVNAGISADPQHLEEARRCAETVLALDADSVHGNRLLGLVDVTTKNSASGMFHLERALAVEPNDPDALLWLSLVYGFAGRTAAAEPLVARLLSIDPLTPFYQMLPGFLALMAGDLSRALRPFEHALELDPSNPVVRLTYAQILAMNGEVAKSLPLFDEMAAQSPQDFFGKLAKLYACSLRDQRTQALACLTPDLTDSAACDVQYAWSVAECLALVGEVDQAMDWVRTAVRQGFWNYKLLFELDPLLHDLHEHASFQALVSETAGYLRTLTRPRAGGLEPAV